MCRAATPGVLRLEAVAYAWRDGVAGAVALRPRASCVVAVALVARTLNASLMAFRFSRRSLARSSESGPPCVDRPGNHFGS